MYLNSSQHHNWLLMMINLLEGVCLVSFVAVVSAKLVQGCSKGKNLSRICSVSMASPEKSNSVIISKRCTSYNEAGFPRNFALRTNS